MRGADWTANELETIRTRWGAGDSAGEIAKTLRGRTRNAVIGMVHRKGFTRDGDVDMNLVLKRRLKAQARDRHAPKWQPRRMERVERPTIVEPLFPDFVTITDCPTGAEAATLSLSKHQCRFPVGDPRHANFHFCNGTQKAGSVYCEHHHSVAYEPKAVRQKTEGYYTKNGLNYRNGAYA